jgi:tRNA 5-methylaminomethyl-2-thiouridine biosynthesis bifunctional protein
MASFRGGAAVESLRREGPRWQLLDAAGRLIEEADAVILANAGDALRLLGAPSWPIAKVRGQISMAPTLSMPALPLIPVAGAGYWLPDVDGCALFGATTQLGDEDARVREQDHADNLAQLARLRGVPLEVPTASLEGRVAWRWVANDRLPVIGPVPDAAAAALASRLDQPRFVPRVPGLFVFTALASRGITWSPLGAQVLASAVSGAPSPLESGLLDAVDPARFAVRQRAMALGRLTATV